MEEKVIKLENQLKAADSHIKECHAAIDQLKNVIQNKRLDYLFKIVDLAGFSTETKVKAIDEIESVMFPKEEVKDAD